MKTALGVILVRLTMRELMIVRLCTLLISSILFYFLVKYEKNKGVV